MFTVADAYALAGSSILVVIGAFMGFACIPRDVDTDRVGCSAMWHEPPLSDVARSPADRSRQQLTAADVG